MSHPLFPRAKDALHVSLSAAALPPAGLLDLRSPSLFWVLCAAVLVVAVVGLSLLTRRIRGTIAEARGRSSTAERRARLLVHAHERERHRIAQRLHDGPVQDLLAHALVTSGLGPPGPVGPHASFAEAAGGLDHVVRDIRAVSESLRPPAVGPLGLSVALRGAADRLGDQHPGIEIGLDLDDDGQALRPDLRLALFRVAQESLGNAAHHGTPLHINVELRLRPDLVTLEIADDGTGFNVPEDLYAFTATGQFGLFGIVAQCEAMDATFSITSCPGRTIVHIEAPVH